MYLHSTEVKVILGHTGTIMLLILYHLSHNVGGLLLEEGVGVEGWDTKYWNTLSNMH